MYPPHDLTSYNRSGFLHSEIMFYFFHKADQKNGTIYEARIGDDALLDCQVTAVERDLVSWFGIDGEFPVILTVGFRPHSSDGRAILVKNFSHIY